MLNTVINRSLKAWANSSLVGNRSAFRKFCRRNRGESFQVTTKHGFKMNLILGDSVENQLLVYGEFEPALSNLLKEIASQEKYLVDIGCNIGYFSCLFTYHAGVQGKCLSVDANPAMVVRCRENLELNQLSGQVLNCAVGESFEKVTLAWPKNAPSHASIGKIKGANLQTAVVEAKPLPHILAEFEWNSRSVLKVDIEGYEVPLLRTLAPIVRQFGHIFFEYSLKTYSNCGFSEKDLWGLSWWDNFQLFGISKKGSIYSLDYRAQIPQDVEMIWAKHKVPW